MTLPHAKLTDLSLYYLKTCPFCMKVLSCISELGVKIKLFNIHEETNKNDLINGGGKKTVPCLRIKGNNGDFWLYESNDIITYLRKLFS